MAYNLYYVVQNNRLFIFLKDHMEQTNQIQTPYQRLIEIIQFTEMVTASIHGLKSEQEIYATIQEAFEKSKDFVTVILTLSADRKELRVCNASLPSKKIKAAEKIGNFCMSSFPILLKKSKILSKVAIDGHTVHFRIRDLVAELFPRPIVDLIWKAAGLRDKEGIVSPIKKHGKIVGAFSMSTPEIIDEFIPSVKTFTNHIATALEYADEYNSLERNREELQKAHDDYRSMTNLTGDIIVKVDVVGKWTYVNDSASDFFGLPAQELIGKAFSDYLHNDDYRITQECVEKVINGETFRGLVNRQKTPQGWRMVEWNGAPVYNEEDKYIGFQATGRDITLQKESELELKESKYNLQQAQFLAKVGTWELYLESGSYLLSEQMQHILGCEKGTFRSIKDILDSFIHADDREVAEKIFLGKFDGFEPNKPINYRIIRPDGKLRWISALKPEVSKYNADGDPVAMFGVVQDITQRKLAIEAMEESELKYKAIYDGSADGILVTDIDTKRFLYANQSFCDMLGYTEDELCQMSVMDIHPRESLNRVIDEFMAQASGKKPLAEDIPCIKKDGSTIYTDVNSKPLEIHGKIFNVGFFRDVTERKLIENEKAVLGEQLRQGEKLAAIGELAGGIAHDFNNILGAIIGYADLIDEESREVPSVENNLEVSRYANIISKASKRATDLVTKLLAFSQRGKYQEKEIVVHNSINDALMLVKENLGKNIFVGRKLTAENTTIIGDPMQIQNAIKNLALNAIDAMPEGGVLLFYTQNETLATGQYFPEIEAGEYLLFSISDTGIGMSPELKSRIFEPFFTTKDGIEKVGLGLASVYGTVKSHGGNIIVESSEGLGTTFTLYFPVQQQDLSLEKSFQQREKGYQHGKGSILIVDKDEWQNDSTGKILIENGYTVFNCFDGKEGIDWYRKNYLQTDIVLLDMAMRCVNGSTCLEKLREINPEARIIITGTTDGKENNSELEKCDDVPFLEKPCDNHNLITLIEGLLSKEGAEKEKENNFSSIDTKIIPLTKEL